MFLNTIKSHKVKSVEINSNGLFAIFSRVKTVILTYSQKSIISFKSLGNTNIRRSSNATPLN